MEQRSTFSIIGERYLDTQHDPEYIGRLEAELGRREVVGLRRAVYEYLAASSLWWNLVWSEWTGLSDKDVRAGWILNATLFSVISALIGLWRGARYILPTFLVLHLITTLVGFGLRAGSKLKAP